MQAAYDHARKSLPSSSQYHLAILFISAPDGADAAKVSAALHKAMSLQTQLATGDFGQLARLQSEDPQTAAKGGDLGFLPDDRLAPGNAPTVRAKRVGQVVGHVKIAQGLYFLKLLEKMIPTLADLGYKLGITVNQIELAKLQPGLK